MTKEEIRYALKDAEAGGVKEQLIEAFKIMYRYSLVKSSDVMRLQEVLEEK